MNVSQAKAEGENQLESGVVEEEQANQESEQQLEEEIQSESSVEENEELEKEEGELQENAEESVDEENMPTLVPGDFFYFLKSFTERIQLALTFDEVEKA